MDLSDLSNRQAKLVKIFLEDLAADGGHMSKADMLRKAGYSEGTTRTPGKIFNNPKVKEKLDDAKQKMLQVRDKALDSLNDQEKLDDTDVNSLVTAVDKMTKNSRLLDDKATENIQIVDDLDFEDE